MIVVTFFLARIDQFKRDDETVEQHMDRMTKIFDEQEQQIKDHGMDSIVEKRAEFPDWLVALIKSLPGNLKPRFWERIKNFFRRLLGIPQKGASLAIYDQDNREWKVFFKDKAEAVKQTGWRTSYEPDTPGRFQDEFFKLIESDPEKMAWSKKHRVQVGGLTEINSDALLMDEDFLDVHRATY